jgi:VanW like protein
MEDTFSLPSELKEGALADFPFILAESISPLHTTADRRERPLLLGKIHNLRLASRNIHGRILLPEQTFSFWRQVGPPWKSRGFEMGREVREGCVIPTPGGGVCQLSGSLLEVALSLGFEITETRAHSIAPGCFR